MTETSALRRWLEQGWYGRSPRLLLRPLAAAYGLIMRARHWAFAGGLFATSHPGVTTIVVGNLTVGGTGKTPLVMWLAQALQARGCRPGILLRGYGGRQRVPCLVNADDDPRQMGDEALLHARRSGCPVAIGVQRVAAAKLLLQAGCDLIISDDGLQHLALRRDLALIVIDGDRGFGNGALLPAGPLRESAALPRAGAMLVLHGADRHGVVPAGVPSFRMHLQPVALRRVDDDQPQSLQWLRGATVHALAGIGHPGRFFGMLRTLGVLPVEHARPDHGRYAAADLASSDGFPFVMTEKDAVKCRALAAGRRDVFYLQVEAVLSEQDAARLIEAVLSAGRV